MASGGARARSGPPADPNALRRDRDGDGWITLAAEGRPGPPPAWPLSIPESAVEDLVDDGDDEALAIARLAKRLHEREIELWAREWARPQALMWERNGQETEVALYVRSLVAAEQWEATTASRTLVRQQQEALGISLPGLARNRWKIAPGAPQEQGETAKPRARSRFKVVTGGAG